MMSQGSREERTVKRRKVQQNPRRDAGKASHSSHPLARRVLGWHIGFSLGAALLFSWAVPFLLLLDPPLRDRAGLSLLVVLVLGGAIGAALGYRRVSTLPFFRSLSRASRSTSASARQSVEALTSFISEPISLTQSWLGPHFLVLVIFVSLFRPKLMGLTTGITIALLTSLMLATASLPLHILIRRDFLRVVEQAPRRLMKSLIERASRERAVRGRINRRLVLAVVAPVVFVALGSALIVNAHLRRADERNREKSAQILARAALELDPGTVRGLEHAIERAKLHGFQSEKASAPASYRLDRQAHGFSELTVPLDSGSVVVRFSSSTIGVIGVAPFLVSLLAAVAAALLGFLLGNVLSADLFYATRGVRLLGTNPALGATGAAVIRRARLRVVGDLFGAIEQLADRFAVFAEAQEDAIEARAAATRTRGLFFASVSHDLKAPLNSILGFTDLVSLEPLTKGQRESLQAIHTRAQELLALIETILDAARVEEGQLSLVTDEVPFKELWAGALHKAAQLSAGFELKVYDEIDANIPPLLIDRVRIIRAFATLIAYSVRTNEGGKMWIRAERESEGSVRIDIDVPRPAHAPKELEAMLSPSTQQGRREHRGLALGLRLARSVVAIHSGSVRVTDRGKKGAMFCVSLPTIETVLPDGRATFRSTPPPAPE